MDKPDIIFKYKGKTYSVGYIACSMNKIRLPNGKLLQVNGWLESYPPKPMELIEIDPDTRSGVLAKEIEEENEEVTTTPVEVTPNQPLADSILINANQFMRLDNPTYVEHIRVGGAGQIMVRWKANGLFFHTIMMIMDINT